VSGVLTPWRQPRFMGQIAALVNPARDGANAVSIRLVTLL
jgi:hypothetical protein